MCSDPTPALIKTSCTMRESLFFEEEKQTMPSCVKRVHEASEMNAVHRSAMEDEHRVIDSYFLPNQPESGYFAVYDGHGGRGVVDYLKTNLERTIREELSLENDQRSVEECLTSAFLISDIETSRENLLLSGSTAATCLVVKEKNDRVLYVANVGDTRVVLARKGKAKRLTYDHKANEPLEVRRIENSGGFVRGKRVMGVLTVSRAFGDHTIKDYILARPYTSTTVVDEEHDEFLIVACDGVWDVFEDQEAVDLVSEALGDQGTTNVAQKLVSKCIDRGTTDNVTALVIEL